MEVERDLRYLRDWSLWGGGDTKWENLGFETLCAPHETG